MGEGPDLIGNTDPYWSPSPVRESSPDRERRIKIENTKEAKRQKAIHECRRRTLPDNTHPQKHQSEYVLKGHSFWLLISNTLFYNWHEYKTNFVQQYGQLTAYKIEDEALRDKADHPLVARVSGIMAVSMGEAEVFVEAPHPDQHEVVRAVKLDDWNDIDLVVGHWSWRYVQNELQKMNWSCLIVREEHVQSEIQLDVGTVDLQITDFSYYKTSPPRLTEWLEKPISFPLLYFIPDSYDNLLKWPTLNERGKVVHGKNNPEGVGRTLKGRARAFIVHKRGYSATPPPRRSSMLFGWKKNKKDQTTDDIWQNNLHVWMTPNRELDDGRDFQYQLSPTFDWIVKGRAIQVCSEKEELRLTKALGRKCTTTPSFISIGGSIVNQYGHYHGVVVPAKIVHLKEPIFPDQDDPANSWTSTSWSWSSQGMSTKSLAAIRFDFYTAFRKTPFKPSFFFLYEAYPDPDPDSDLNDATTINITAQMAQSHPKPKPKNNELVLHQTFAQLLGLSLNTPKLKPCTLHDFKLALYPSRGWDVSDDDGNNNNNNNHARKPIKRHAHVYPRQGARVRGVAIWVDREAIADVIQSYFPESLSICSSLYEIELDTPEVMPPGYIHEPGSAVINMLGPGKPVTNKPAANDGSKGATPTLQGLLSRPTPLRRNVMARLISPHTAQGCLARKLRKDIVCV